MGNESRRKLSNRLLECFCFYRKNSTLNYHLTSSDVAVTLYQNGQNVIYSPAQINRSEINRRSDETFDTVTITTSLIEPILSAVKNEFVEGVKVKIYQIYTDSSESIFYANDYSLIFWGYASSFTRSDNAVSASFVSHTKYLESEVPRFNFCSTCNYVLYDKYTCKVDANLYKETLQISNVSFNNRVITVIEPGVQKAAGYYIGGKVGFANGEMRSINNDVLATSSRKLTLLGKVPQSVASLQYINAYAGCDHTFTTCRQKFQNNRQFGGFPFIKVKNIATDLR